MLRGWLLGKQTLRGTGKHREATGKEMGELGGGKWEALGGAEGILGLARRYWRC